MILSLFQIRAASYGVITALCEQLPFFIKDRAKVFCAAALGSLSDSDPVVVGALWEAALMVIGKVKVHCTLYTVYMYILHITVTVVL